MSATVVLVHGAWHGAWCWRPVERRIRSKALDVVALDLPGHGDSTEPLGDFEADVATVTATLDAADGPVVLVGHSYGGAVISAAGHHDAVRDLAFVCAWMPDRDETVSGLADQFPVDHDEPAMKMEDDGLVLTDYGLREVLYHDASTALDTARLLVVPENLAKFQTPGGNPAWLTKPVTYVRCLLDRIAHPDLQTFLAERAEADIIDLDVGHMPQFAAADALTTAIAELARG
ncbi:MAG: alpha/beta hydrolase [Actinomycetota bacterium]